MRIYDFRSSSKHPPILVSLLVRPVLSCYKQSINEEHLNPDYLVGVPLPPNLRATTDSTAALARAQCIFHAIPIQVSKKYLSQYVEKIRVRHPKHNRVG